MRFRTLLLGTAAAFAVSGGAQAADLAIAVEPIDYVKICDAFGVGYWYIPGTDTCLKIGGHVELNVWIYDDDRAYNYFNVASELTGATTDPSNPLSDTTGAVAGYLYMLDEYKASWAFTSEAGANFNSRSMSDLGVIATSFAFVTTSDNATLDGSAKTVRFDGGYGAIGPIMFGWTDSLFDPGGGYTYDMAVRSDKKTDQIRLSYLMGTWGVMLGLEDPRDRYAGPKNATGDWPDIVLAVTGGVGGLNLRAAGAITSREKEDGSGSTTGWGVNIAATAKLGVVDLKATAAYSDNAKSYTGGSNCSNGWDPATASWSVGCDDGEWWSMFVSGAVMLSSNLKAAATVSWQDTADSRKNMGALSAAAGLYYYPTARSEIGAEVQYFDPETGSDTWGIRGKFKTHFN
jgi:hypothetical protein